MASFLQSAEVIVLFVTILNRNIVESDPDPVSEPTITIVIGIMKVNSRYGLVGLSVDNVISSTGTVEWELFLSFGKWCHFLPGAGSGHPG